MLVSEVHARDPKRRRVVEHPMFPGLIFISVCDIDKHWARIKIVPGVQKVGCSDGKAIVLTDVDINRIQLMEMRRLISVKHPNLLAAKVRKRRKERVEHEDGNMTIITKGWLSTTMDLEAEARTAAFAKLIGLDR